MSDRLLKMTMLGWAMSVIGIGTGWAATYYVPTTQYPSIYSAYLKCSDGDVIELTNEAELKSTPFTINKVITLTSQVHSIVSAKTKYPWVIAKNGCHISGINFINHPDFPDGVLIKINTGVSSTWITECRFEGCVEDGYTSIGILENGGSYTHIVDCVFSNMAYGVSTNNANNLYICGSGEQDKWSWFEPLLRGINLYAYSGSQKYYSITNVNFWGDYSGVNSNIRSRTVNTRSRLMISGNFMKLEHWFEDGRPIILKGNNDAGIYSNGFDFCRPDIVPWSTESSDVITCGGNYIMHDACQCAIPANCQ